MQKINYFNICAVIILFLIVISIIMRKLYRDQRGKHFFTLVSVVFISALFDCFAVFLDNLGDGHLIMKYFTHTGYILFHNFTPPMFVIYIIALMDTWHIIRKSPVLSIGLFIPFILEMAVIILNPINQLLFYFDVNDTYTRGKYFFILYIITILYVLCFLCLLLIHRKNLPFGRWLSIISLVPFMMTAVIIQMIYPYCRIEMFTIAVSVLFMTLMIQRPEENIDVTTGLRSENAYAADVKLCFLNKKKNDIILIHLANHSALSEILKYSETGKVSVSIAKKLNNISDKYAAQAEIYSLRRGCFAIILDEPYTNLTDNIANEIEETLKEPLHINHVDFSFIVNICIMRCLEDFEDFDSLSRFMSTPYDKKYYGKITYANDIIKAKSYDVMQNIDSIIKNAIDNNKLFVYYQPIYSVKEKRFTGAEALIRLIDDKYGFVSPEYFIPAAEKNGLIHQIGKFVFESVCQFIAEDNFSQLGIEYIDVNLSAAQCMNKKLSDEFIEIMKKYNISSKQIVLEITETAAVNEQNVMAENISSLSDYGIKFSLDDFGTGYSNMQRIASLPLSVTKLDKIFTAYNDNKRLEAVTEGAVSMIKSMNMAIVVEGVETQEMFDKFTILGCEFIQGYFFSKPLPHDDFINFCHEKNKMILMQ
ncbi:MAG: EAL domain-containing protein [Oscillospiraceae bacterium]